MQISIIKPGFLSILQDLGRNLFRSQAVPVSGAMDTLSARIANKAIGNNDGAVVIEFSCATAVFIADTDILIAYAGDCAILKSGDRYLPAERPLFIPAGKVLNFTKNPAGSRTYLAVSGGWDVPEVLGSRSTYLTASFGGFQGRPLQKGDLLKSSDYLTSISKKILSRLEGREINFPNWGIARQLLLPVNRKNIRVVPAQEFIWFDGRSMVDFLSKPYTLTAQSNRMGYHLEGSILNRIIKDELLSTAVVPGTIQVTGNGSLVLLMADCQTTGGYPRIAQVAAIDLPLCGQLSPGDQIYFKEISGQEAEMLYLEREQQLRKLTLAVQHKFD